MDFNSTNELTVRKLKGDESIPYHLLLIADETVLAINRYIHDSEIYLCEYEARPIAVCAFKVVNAHIVEIKNLAVKQDFQGKGVGSYLLNSIADQASKRNFKSLLIGTGDKAKRQLKLYRELGFADFDILKDFYLLNYANPIFENGEQLKDMIILKKELPTRFK
ncbi:MAG: GNAT family N-acetyltransferase [Chryseolinea sp.]